MSELVARLAEVGAQGIDYFWIPVGVWTAAGAGLCIIISRWEMAGARLRHLAYTALLVSLPLGFAAAPLTGGLRAPVLNSRVQAVDFRTAREADVGPAATIPATDLPEATVEPPRSIPAAPEVPVLYVIAGLATIVVGVLGIVGLFRFVLNLAALARLVRTMDSRGDGPVAIEIQRQSRALGLRRTPRLMAGSAKIAPMTFGSRRPVVVLPREMFEGGADITDVKHSIAHELVHVRRRDYAMGMLSRLVSAPFLWHPLVRTLKQQVETQRELACDAEVVATYAVEPRRYATTLVNVSHLAFAPLGLSISNSKKLLTQRIEAMKTSTSQPIASAGRLTSFALAALFLATPAFFLACSSPQSDVASEDNHQSALETAEYHLSHLEAEVAYLDTQLEEIGEEIAMIQSDESLDEDNLDRLLYEPRVRQRILSPLRYSKRQELEMARMEVAVQHMLDD